MKNTITYNVAFGCIITFFCFSLSAQNSQVPNSYSSDSYETHKRVGNYMELKKLGYQEKEIFEDLGNANFLTKNYETALFWYKKLMQMSENGTLSSSYHRRYQYALEKSGTSVTSSTSDEKDWLAVIQSDYGINNNPLGNSARNSFVDTYGALNPQLQIGQFQDYRKPTENGKKSYDIGVLNGKNAYKAPITITADGKTAFFSKAIYVKPPHGIFAKKELFHKIYRADKVDGQWENIKEIALCPKYYSALHPTVSEDGRRLFFASDMPGTLGKYDIYVSTVNRDGNFGIAKNLGEKVNTKKNDLYPNIVNGNTLFFASDGRNGEGGLDVFMAQVDYKKVGMAVNLGSPINSMDDDFSIRFMTKNGMGYVVSNRGKDKGTIQQVAFSYDDKMENSLEANREYNVVEALTNDLRINYSTSVFEDE